MLSLLKIPSGPFCGDALSLLFNSFNNDDEPISKPRKIYMLILEQKQAKEIKILADVANYNYNLIKQYAYNN